MVQLDKPAAHAGRYRVIAPLGCWRPRANEEIAALLPGLILSDVDLFHREGVAGFLVENPRPGQEGRLHAGLAAFLKRTERIEDLPRRRRPLVKARAAGG